MLITSCSEKRKHTLWMLEQLHENIFILECNTGPRDHRFVESRLCCLCYWRMELFSELSRQFSELCGLRGWGKPNKTIAAPPNVQFSANVRTRLRFGVKNKLSLNYMRAHKLCMVRLPSMQAPSFSLGVHVWWVKTMKRLKLKHSRFTGSAINPPPWKTLIGKMISGSNKIQIKRLSDAIVVMKGQNALIYSLIFCVSVLTLFIYRIPSISYKLQMRFQYYPLASSLPRGRMKPHWPVGPFWCSSVRTLIADALYLTRSAVRSANTVHYWKFKNVN